MLSICPACRLPSEKLATGLPCEDCCDSLLRAPEICEVCLGLACLRGDCARRWMRVEGDEGIHRFTSVRATYLSLGPGADILKSWKKNSGPALGAFLRAGVRETLLPRPTVIVPVPQSRARKWALDGGSVLRMAGMVRAALPESVICDLLTLDPPRMETQPNQARTKGAERYARKSQVRAITREEWEANPENTEAVAFLESEGTPQLLLIDDFLTSGATLRASAAAVREACENLALFLGKETEVHVFVLGFRPTLFH